MYRLGPKKKENKKKKERFMKLSVEKVFRIGMSLDKLLSQQGELPLNVGYDLWRMKKQLDDIGSYVMERLKMVISEEHMQNNELDTAEQIAYETVLKSEVDISPFKITTEELFQNKEVVLTVSDISDIMELFDEKSTVIDTSVIF